MSGFFSIFAGKESHWMHTSQPVWVCRLFTNKITTYDHIHTISLLSGNLW